MLYDKPLIPVHHLAGHIYANQYAGEFKYPLLCVVVSGGNTQLVIMKHDLDFTIIGETKDDAVGECYDKVARVLGMQQFYHPTYDRFGITNGLKSILYDSYDGTNPKAMEQMIYLCNNGHALKRKSGRIREQ